MELLTTSYQYSTKLLKLTVNRVWKRSFSCQLILVFICLAIIIFAWHIPLLVGFAGGILYHAFIQLISQYKKTKHILINSFKILTTTAIITEQGYQTTSQATYLWSDMKAIYRYSDSWQIILSYGAFLILPLQDIPVTIQADILERAKAAGCKIK